MEQASQCIEKPASERASAAQGSVKHQPATPLPWREGPTATVETNNIGWRGIWTQDKRVSIADVKGSTTPSSKNAAYITHACNSYPKLVEALRDSVSDLRTVLHVIDREGTREQVAKHTPGMIGALRRALQKREALLRELGE